ncbi:MAG: ABC transporter ATP-binding protein [Bacillota bacterium]
MNALELRNICKYFGDFCANDNIDFDLREGEIHAILGENGAGKSTLMNVLYGMHVKDAGTVKLFGEQVAIRSPSDAIGLGIGMVHQHFALIPQLTVAQNIFIGMKETGFVLHMRELEKRVRQANDLYGFNVDPCTPVWQLPVGVQQKVEILKILIRKAKILILDEPTAVLTLQEVEELFESLKKLTALKCSVILITHKIEDVVAHCDRVTVLRDGKVTGTLRTNETDKNQLVKMMVGRNVSLIRKSQRHEYGDVLLNIRHLNARNDKNLPAVKDVSLSVRAGEILGIAGVDGNGQLELAEAITGLRRFTGTISFGDGDDLCQIQPIQIIHKGVGHIPDDRHKKGLILPFTIKENLVLGSQRDTEYAKGLFIRQKAVDNAAVEMIRQFDIRPPDAERVVGTLSGGNQQKVIVAREFHREPRILIAIQPTRGLDIGATEFVWEKIIEARNLGKAILLISTDLDEVYSLSDTIAVMLRGELSRKMDYNIPIEKLGLMMSGTLREDSFTSEESETTR